MQNTSEVWKRIVANEYHHCEYKADVAGTEYSSVDISSVELQMSCFSDTLSIGNVCAAELKLKILQKAPVPRMAEIKLYIRIVNDLEVSEWIPKGYYYIDTREQSGEWLSLVCYDKVLMLEKPFLQHDDVPDFPMLMTDVVQVILDRLNIELDSRTVINPAYTIEYTELTMREVLGFIACAHAGNFVISDEGKLRLVEVSDSGIPSVCLWVDESGNFVIDEFGNYIELR